jgi:hypothetical protein
MVHNINQPPKKPPAAIAAFQGNLAIVKLLLAQKGIIRTS